MAEVVKNTLGYLGTDFQFKLVSAFIEDPSFFKNLYPIINQNMFTDTYLKVVVGVMKDYYAKYEVTASYDMLLIKLREKANTDDERECYEETIETLRSETSEGVEEIESLAERFFKQQNLIRVANGILKLASNGDVSKYDACQALIEEAMSIGKHDEMSMSPLDNIESDLSKENSITIPTGVSKLDECLGGGLDIGKIGLIMGPTSFGKALADNEFVATPSGFKMIKYINVGDEVIGYNGKPTKVIGVFPQGKRDIYKVTFSDGAECRCDREHLWSVNSVYQANKSFESLRTMTLAQIMRKGLRTKDGRHRFRIPLCSGVVNEGVRLGNIDDYMSLICEFYGVGTNSGLADNLYIEIMNSHYDDRLAILNKLMDKFGTVVKNNYPYFSSISYSFSQFVRTLVLSLGGFAECIQSGKEYKTIVRMPETVKVFSDETKQKNVKHLTGRAKYRFIESVEFDRKQDAICIKVDADDELFLTRDYIVTHNTSMTTGFAAYAATYKCKENNNEGYKVLQIVFEDSNRDINRKYFSRLTQVETSRLNESTETTESVKQALFNHPDKDDIKNNIRVMKLDTGTYSASDIIRIIKKEINKGFKPQAVMLDYLECLEPEKGCGHMPKHEQETKTMRRLENGVKELGVALWLPTQGNRSSVSSELVTMDQGAGAFTKQQIAQVVVSISRSVDDIKEKRATVSVLKNRSGNAGIVLNGIKFDNGTCTISCDDVIDFDSVLAYDEYAEQASQEIQSQFKKSLMTN